MLAALLSVGLGTLIAAGLAALTGTLADAFEAGAVALLIGVLGGHGVVVGRGDGGEKEADFGEDFSQRDQPVAS